MDTKISLLNVVKRLELLSNGLTVSQNAHLRGKPLLQSSLIKVTIDYNLEANAIVPSITCLQPTCVFVRVYLLILLRVHYYFSS